MPIPFRPIARALTRTLKPAPAVDMSAAQGLFIKGRSQDPREGVLVTVNHYSAADFQSWWFVIPISANLPVEIHWVVASAWRDSGWLTGLTRWLFPRGAKLLGFSAMPPIPPDPAETEARARAVREVLHYARRARPAVVGMAPEGGDQPGGILGDLPPGVGRFLLLISRSCPQILPVGAWKEQDCIHLKFGAPYWLEVPTDLPPDELDHLVGQIVMRRIATLLPERLRGQYGEGSN